MAKIIGIIGWIGTALVFGAVAVRFFTPPWPWWTISTRPTWRGPAWRACSSTWPGSGATSPTFYKGRSARYGTMSIVSVVVFLGILVAINYLSTRQNKRWDFTANQVYSLSDQTVKVLKELHEPVKFTVYDQQANFDRFRDRLDEFTVPLEQRAVEYVDPDASRRARRRRRCRPYGTIVIEYKDRTERVTSTDEQALTNALIKAVTGAAKKVYFTQGHGEKNTAAPIATATRRSRRR